MNTGNNSLIINNKDLSLIEKLKSIRSKLAKFRAENNNKNKISNKTDFTNSLINKYYKKHSVNNSINSINDSSNSVNKNIIVNKKINKKKKINNKSYDISNNNTIRINRIIDKSKKTSKLKNKTPGISGISTSKNKKIMIIGYNCLNKRRINNNDMYKNTNSSNNNSNFNKKLNKIKISYENNLYKKQDIRNNNSIEWKKLNINLFNNYVKKSKEKSSHHQKRIKDISTIKKKPKKKYYSVTPLNVSINNKPEKSTLRSINNSRINKSKVKNSSNSNSNRINNFKEYKKNVVKNGSKGKKNHLKKNCPSSSVNNSIVLDEKFNIKIKNNIYNDYNNNNQSKNKKNLYNKKIKQILSKSQQEIEKIRNDFVIHFTNKNTTKNSPIKTKLNNGFNNISITKKIKKNINNKIVQINKNSLPKKTNFRKIIEKYRMKKNKEKNKEKEKINELKYNLLKINNKYIINDINTNSNNNDNIAINNKDNKSDKDDKDGKDENLENENQNCYLKESIKLSNYIKNYYKENKKYPQTNLDFYKYGRLIGQGAFGKVNIGLNVLTGRIVAIKSIDKNKFDTESENMKKILYECNLMKKLNHPNITKILEMVDDEKFFLIIMEYINGGNLFSFVKKRRKLSEKTAKFLFRQIILGIQHMHSKNIVHRDIKLENILIDLNNNIKICDFGISLVLNSLTDKLYDHCGTPMYIAPEILLSNENQGYIGPPVDIWSAGIALYIMLSGNIPFSITDISNGLKKQKENGQKSKDPKTNNFLLQYSILTKEPEKIEDISDLAQDLLKGLLNKDPTKRLTVEQILKHPWLYYDDNYKYHLFTKTEMIMLSKTFVDYRYTKIKDLLENFTISNLKNDNTNNDKNMIEQNVITKSSILAPYNSLINEETLVRNENRYNNDDSISDDFKNNDIKFENNYIIFSNKTKELNMLYELNNNEEIDNGIIINSKTNSTRSNKLNISQEYDFINNNNNVNEKEKINDNILDKIEELGYNREFASNIIETNELSHVYAIYFLLNNYDKIQ